MRENLPTKLNKYLSRTMLFGVVVITLGAVLSSIISHKINYRENQITLDYLANSLVAGVSRRIAEGDYQRIKNRMEFHVENEKERNLQIKLVDTKGTVLHQSSGYVGDCTFELFTFRRALTVCSSQEMNLNNTVYGRVFVTRDVRSLFAFFIEFYFPALAFVLFVFISLFYIMNRRFLKTNVTAPLHQLVQSLDENRNSKNDYMSRDKPQEWNLLYHAIQDYRKKITDYILKQNKTSADLEREKILSEVTSQLVYDIRSPLEALDKIAGNLPELDQEKRTLIRKATSRIHNIANNLLNREVYQKQQVSLQMISSFVKTMIFEKREQYKSNKISINDYIDPNMYGAFAMIEIDEFKNVLSHVIDNAVQAIASTGFVRVALTQNEDSIVVDIFDNGGGISPEILPRVTSRGFTHNKPDGKGLGLYLVDQKMREWGGKLEIQSTVGNGTSIRLIFKKEDAPAWFLSELIIHDDGQYVILDDEYATHEMWEDKILQSVQQSIKIHHFYNEKEFEEWFRKNTKFEKISYFVDYELVKSQKSGLDLIEEFGIADQSVLVTSYYDNEEIQQRCERLGVKIIPKEMAKIVPIVNP